MRVYKCDRCWKYVEIESRCFFVRKPTPLYRIGLKKHLCEDCAKSFREWFDDPNVNEESK